MIQINSLKKDYGSHKVLKSIDLKIQKGKINAIIGPNACGKSTLVKCILGLVLPNNGEISIDGKKMDSQGEFLRKIGYMPQTPRFPSHLNLLELLKMLEDLRSEKSLSKDFLIEYFDLQSVLHQPLGELSGGTRQKVAAVIAFMFDQPIIILDEPSVGLDPLASGYFKDLLLNKVKEGITILLVSHIMTEVEQLAENIIYINDGDIIYNGPLKKLLEESECSSLERALIKVFKQQEEKE